MILEANINESNVKSPCSSMGFFDFGKSGVLAVLILLLLACNKNQNDEQHWVEFTGQTMGTSYKVIYQHDEQQNLKPQIDSVLIALNNSVSTYIPESLISQFNSADTGEVIEVDQFFYEIFSRAKEIHKATEGAFDPTVMPLVNFWGFGWEEEKANIDTTQVDSLRLLVQFDKVMLDMVLVPRGEMVDTFYRLEKKVPGVQLDFSAIAKGYGADVVGELLAQYGLKNYFIEIGGEVATKGNYKEGAPWKIAIEKPVEGDINNRQRFAIVGVTGEAMATSGNYRNYREVNGRKIVHTINPKTGYPEVTDLLSASIIAPDCMTADAYATAFMVMGLREAMAFAESNDMEAFFIYTASSGELEHAFTSGFEQYIIEEEVD